MHKAMAYLHHASFGIGVLGVLVIVFGSPAHWPVFSAPSFSPCAARMWNPTASAFATAAFLLLHIILCIGPLCRLNPKFQRRG